MARRAQSILLVIALLATPLALLARGIACDSSCDCMVCCMAHRASGAPSATTSRAQGTGSSCAHDVAGHMTCGMHTKHSALDFGFIAPMAPTFIEPLIHIAAPAAVRQPVANFKQFPFATDLSVPLEPPRV